MLDGFNLRQFDIRFRMWINSGFRHRLNAEGWNFIAGVRQRSNVAGGSGGFMVVDRRMRVGDRRWDRPRLRSRLRTGATANSGKTGTMNGSRSVIRDATNDVGNLAANFTFDLTANLPCDIFDRVLEIEPSETAVVETDGQSDGDEHRFHRIGFPLTGSCGLYVSSFVPTKEVLQFQEQVF